MRGNTRGSRAWRDTAPGLFDPTGASWEGGGGTGLSVKPGREPSGGEIASENDDMSSDKGGERPPRRKSKGSCLKLI